MNPNRFAVNWHSEDGEFTHCTVTPITVVREGVLPGCTGVTITARDSDGIVFHGSPSHYFESEKAAWDHVRTEIIRANETLDTEIKKNQDQLARQFNYLMTLEKKP